MPKTMVEREVPVCEPVKYKSQSPLNLGSVLSWPCWMLKGSIRWLRQSDAAVCGLFG